MRRNCKSASSYELRATSDQPVLVSQFTMSFDWSRLAARSSQLLHHRHHVRRLRNPQRPVHALNKRLRIDSDQKRRKRGNTERGTHSITNVQSLAHHRLTNEDGVRNLQIVIEPEQDVEHRD